MGWVALVLFVVGMVAWPLLQGALLEEGVRVLTGRRASTGALVAAVLLVPLAVVEIGLGCVTGGLATVAPLGLLTAALTLAVGVAVRAWGYATVLEVPGPGAVGLAIGVMLVNLVYGGMMLVVVGGSLWAAGWFAT